MLQYLLGKIIRILAIFLVGGSLALLLAWYPYQRGDRNFQKLTGKWVPHEMLADHDSRGWALWGPRTDFWLLRASAHDLKILAQGWGFQPSSQALQRLPGDLEFSGRRYLSKDLLEGYEAEYSPGHSMWMLVFAPGTRAVVIR